MLHIFFLMGPVHILPQKNPSRFELFIVEINSFSCAIQVRFSEIILFTVMKSGLSHKMNYFILWERPDFVTVNKRISKKHTCIVHGNELISTMKSSNRLGFFCGKIWMASSRKKKMHHQGVVIKTLK